MADVNEYTYRGKTFRVGDNVEIKRSVGGWAGEEELLGHSVQIFRVDNADNTLRVFKGDYHAWISMDSTFESDQKEEPADDNPLGMPELKIWMRFLSDAGGTPEWYIVLPDTEGNLQGFSRGGWHTIEDKYDLSFVLKVAEAPHWHSELLDFSYNPVVIWERASVEKQKKAAEAQELKDEIAALQEKLKELE